MTAKVWGRECKHLESSLLTAQAWRNEWLSRVQLQARLWFVFKTVKLSGSRTIATRLDPRVGQLHMRNLTQSTIFQTERSQTAGERGTKAAVRPIQDTTCSDNILRLIIIQPKFYSFVDVNDLNHTQSSIIKPSKLFFNLLLFVESMTITSILKKSGHTKSTQYISRPCFFNPSWGWFLLWRETVKRLGMNKKFLMHCRTWFLYCVWTLDSGSFSINVLQMKVRSTIT